MKTPIQFHLNGEEVAAFVESGANLLDTLRESVGDLSVKGGCWQGTCGTCTVLIDGVPRVSCVTLAETCAGKSVETVAGLRRGPDLHPLQNAFMERFAAQCGYCTPGMLMAAKALLDRNPNPTRGRRGRCALRQHLPLYRIRADHRGGARRRPQRQSSPRLRNQHA